MKKVLFATTALMATASVAAAEVRFSGYGRFGIGYLEDRTAVYPFAITTAATSITTTQGGSAAVALALPGAVATEGDEIILVSRFRLNIDGVAETDSGVQFSARVRLQADENASNGEANSAGLNGARFSAIYEGLRVDAGNVSGAFDNLPNYYGNEPGLENFIGQYAGVNYNFLGYSSTGPGANAVFFQYAVGDFAFGASYDQRDIVVVDAVTPSIGVSEADRWDISVQYSFDNITAALAYGETKGDLLEKSTLTVLTLGGEWGDFSGTLFVADDDVAVDELNGTAYGLSLAYNIGAATTLTAAYGGGSADLDTESYGIGAIYDLGGGASLRGGIGQSKVGDGDGRLRADFGAQFNF